MFPTIFKIENMRRLLTFCVCFCILNSVFFFPKSSSRKSVEISFETFHLPIFFNLYWSFLFHSFENMFFSLWQPVQFRRQFFSFLFSFFFGSQTPQLQYCCFVYFLFITICHSHVNLNAHWWSRKCVFDEEEKKTEEEWNGRIH